MTATAVVTREWGFVFLEGVWGLVSLWGIADRLRGTEPPPTHLEGRAVDLTLEFLGAIGVLLPFALLQAGRLSQHAYTYLTLNLVGSGVLTAAALLDRQWGFVILQGVWSLVAGAGILRRLRRPIPAPSSPDHHDVA